MTMNDEWSKDVDLRRMLEEEKRARLDNDFKKSIVLVKQIINYLFNKGDLESLRNMVSSLNKKRNQSKQAITEMVKDCLNEIYFQVNEDEQIKLLKTLIEITEGRIYVEYEYSVCVRRLTEINLKRGNIEEAAKQIQDIQIETFGSIERPYKIDYILFQMRILLNKQDYIRTLIVSNKVTRRHLNDEGLEKQKLEFYELIIQYYLHENQFLDVAKSYKILFDFVKELELKASSSETLKKETLDNYKAVLASVNKQILFFNYVMYLAICPPELEAKNMLNELNLFYKKDLEENKDMLQLVTIKLNDDIVQINENLLGQFAKYPIFMKDALNPDSDKHFKLFRKYLIQHDITIFQKFFSQVSLNRISQIIGINKSEVEAEIADMVINKYIYAKINRINSIVNFKPKQSANDKLDDLNFDLSKMLEKLENTCHLIHKENLKFDIK